MTVLGIVWRLAPCTAYAVMREFATSSSSYFRGSAGAIYPLVARLEGRGVLTGKTGSQGNRVRRVYHLSRRGRAALRRWIVPPLPEADVSFAVDPIRTRTYFLGVLPPSDRLAFAVEAEARLRDQLRQFTADRAKYRDPDDPFSELAYEGSLYVTRARLRWATKLREWVEGRADD